jgi:hypothetical protein
VISGGFGNEVTDESFSLLRDIYRDILDCVQSNCNEISRLSPLSSLHRYILPGREVIAYCQKLLGMASVPG